MPSLKNVLVIVSISLFLLELFLHLPFFDSRMRGLHTLLSKYRYFAHRKDSDELRPSEKMFDPVLGWRAGPKKSSPLEREKVNSQRWRSNKEFTKEKTKKRIVILGDSFLYGQGLNDEMILANRLQDLLGDSFEVYNFAVEGYSWDQIYAVATTEVPQYSPDWLIIGIIKNDLDLERNCLSYAWGSVQKPYFKIKDGNIYSPNTPISSPKEILRENLGMKTQFINQAVSLFSDLSLARAAGVIISKQIQKQCWQTSLTLLEDILKRYPLKEKLVFAEMDPLPQEFSVSAKKLPLTYIQLYQEEKKLAETSKILLDTTDGFHPGKNANELGARFLMP